MGKANTTASWIGKAAYEMISGNGLSGRDANARARELADGLLDFGIDLARIDPREYARGGEGKPGAGSTAITFEMSRGAIERQNRQSAFLNRFTCHSR